MSGRVRAEWWCGYWVGVPFRWLRMVGGNVPQSVAAPTAFQPSRILSSGPFQRRCGDCVTVAIGRGRFKMGRRVSPPDYRRVPLRVAGNCERVSSRHRSRSPVRRQPFLAFLQLPRSVTEQGQNVRPRFRDRHAVTFECIAARVRCRRFNGKREVGPAGLMTRLP